MVKAQRYTVIKTKLHINLYFTNGMYKWPLDWPLNRLFDWLVLHVKLSCGSASQRPQWFGWLTCSKVNDREKKWINCILKRESTPEKNSENVLSVTAIFHSFISPAWCSLQVSHRWCLSTGSRYRGGTCPSNPLKCLDLRNCNMKSVCEVLKKNTKTVFEYLHL